jgi:hypothetical protein
MRNATPVFRGISRFLTSKTYAIGQNIIPHSNQQIPSFPSALQLRASFGLLKYQPPFFSIPHLSCPSFPLMPISVQFIHPRLIVWFSEQFSFYGVRLLASRPTPNLEDQGIPLRLAPT